MMQWRREDRIRGDFGCGRSRFGTRIWRSGHGFCAAARGCRAGPRRRVRPRRGHPNAAGDDGKHEIGHLGLADLPVGGVEREQPRSVQDRQPDEKRQRPVLVKTDVLVEALQPTVGRHRPHRSRTLAGNVAEVHAARAEHADDDPAERLQTALAQIDLGAQDLREGGNGFVRHRTFPRSESSSRIHSAALSQHSVV